MNMHSVPRRQRGVALVIGLIFLVLVSLIATVGMRQSITQERMAGGLRNESLARSGGETALRAGERQLFDYYLTSAGAALAADDVGSQGVYRRDATTARAFRESDPNDFVTTGTTALPSAVTDYTTATEYTARLAQQPVFLIEDLGPVRPQGAGSPVEGGASGPANYQGQGAAEELRIYRVSARATGGLGTVVRTVESTYIARTQG